MRKVLLASWALLSACGSVKGQAVSDAPEIDAPLTCDPPETLCGDRCVNTNNDPDHCGSCDPCALENATAGCVQGECVIAACAAGFCDSDGAGGCEVQPDFQTDEMHCGNCDTVCVTGLCSAGGCARRIFITTNTHAADFGGLTQADALCQADAQGNGLGGIWKAWLADAADSPLTRFNLAGSFVRVDLTTVIANDFTDLTDGSLDNAVLTMANGQAPAIGFCWTNVVAGGGGGGSSCNNWTSVQSSLSGSRGQHNLTNGMLSGGGSQNCDPNLVPPARLYCVEQ